MNEFSNKAKALVLRCDLGEGRYNKAVNLGIFKESVGPMYGVGAQSPPPTMKNHFKAVSVGIPRKNTSRNPQGTTKRDEQLE